MCRIEGSWNLDEEAWEGLPEKVTLGKDLKEVQRCTGPEAGGGGAGVLEEQGEASDEHGQAGLTESDGG